MMNLTENLSEENQSSHTADIFGVNNYEADRSVKKVFLPWHKPRKQYVRHEQWTVLIAELLEEDHEKETLKYLGLPGDDLLDLRYFHEKICQPKQVKLKYLGFNNGANSSLKGNPELNISLHEVNNLKYIDNSSLVIPDNFCQIANPNSIAWERSKKMGPYDIINIDLCDGFGKQPHDQFLDTHYNTLDQLMVMQARKSSPWLLFITTRTGPEHTDPGILSLLKAIYHNNLLECEEFLKASNSYYKITDQNSLDISATTPKGMSDIFLISLCKWIAKMGLIQNPQALVELKSTLGYRIKRNVEYEDLISLAIKITPTERRSIQVPGPATSIAESLNECEIALQVVHSINKLIDVDAILDTNTAIKEQMIEDSISLLMTARYDVSEYSKWAS